MDGLKKPNTKAPRIIRTIFSCVFFFILGFSIAIPGPTILDLQIAIKGTLQEVSLIIPCRAGGVAIGSTLASFVPTKGNLDNILTLGLLGACLCLGYMPWARSLYPLLGSMTVCGILTGFLEVVANVYNFQLWDKEGPLVTQTLYLSLGLGSFFAPILAAPFLLEKDEIGANTTAEVTKLHPDALIPELQIHFPYNVTASIGLVVCLVFAILSRKYPYELNKSKKCEEDQEPKISKLRVLPVIILGSAVCHLQFGAVVAFGSMLETYLVKGPTGMNKSDAAYLTSAYWGAFALFRLFALLIVKSLGPFYTLILEFLLVISGCVALTFGNHIAFMWIAAVLLGLGLSAIFALILSYLQEFMELKSMYISALITASVVGEFVYPVLITAVMELDFSNYILVTDACCGAMCLLFVIFVITCRQLLATK